MPSLYHIPKFHAPKSSLIRPFLQMIFNNKKHPICQEKAGWIILWFIMIYGVAEGLKTRDDGMRGILQALYGLIRQGSFEKKDVGAAIRT